MAACGACGICGAANVVAPALLFDPAFSGFLGFDRNRGGAGPLLIAYDKVTDAVQNLGPLFDTSSPYSYSTGEGWYFSGTQPTKLYTLLAGSAQL